MTIGLFFGILGILVVIGTPLAVLFGGLSIVPYLMDPSFPLTIEASIKSMVSGLNSFVILAVPLFMLSGTIMARGGISKKLFDLFAYFFGNKTAGFPSAVIITCLFFGAISGSSVATVAAVGAMSIGILTEMGYGLVFSTAIVTVSGGLGVIIPPSIGYIVYAGLSSASPASLFIAGFLPGCLIAICLILYCYYYCKKHGEDKEKLMARYNELRKKGFRKLFMESFWAVLTPVIILGSIYGGICSPTEAATISVVYAIVVSVFIYKSLPLKSLPKMFIEGAKTYVNLLVIISFATSFARAMTILQYTSTIADSIMSVTTNSVVIILLMNAIMLFFGCVLDFIPNFMLLTPIFLPVAASIGMSPIHLGIMMTVNLAIGAVPSGHSCTFPLSA